MTYEEKYNELKKFINREILGELKADNTKSSRDRSFDSSAVALISRLVGKINDIDEK